MERGIYVGDINALFVTGISNYWIYAEKMACEYAGLGNYKSQPIIAVSKANYMIFSRAVCNQ